jgi:hypothetical protein
MDQRSTTHPRQALRALVLAVALGGAAACGGDVTTTTSPGAGGGAGTPSGATAATPTPGATATAGTAGPARLQVVVDTGAGAPTTWQLTCEPPGGTHPDPAAACAALAAGAGALEPPAKDQQCTQLYGGPQTAVVTGTWQGRAVRADLSREDGCQVARWRALEGLLPAAGG